MSLDNQHVYWDSVAQTKTFTHPVDRSMLERFISKDELIVDYGCGYGRVVSELNAAGFTNVLGFDTSVELINRGNENTHFELEHVEDHHTLSVENDSVACVLLFAVLTCIASNAGQLDLIHTLATKLKPNGILYISDYYLQDNSAEMERYEYLNDDPDNYGVFSLAEGATFRHHPKDWILKLLADFNILEEKMIEVATMNGHPAKAFQIIAQKK